MINSLIWLDGTKNNYTGFINLFLMKFCKIAGIGPIAVNSNSCFLNIQEGVFQLNDNAKVSNSLVPKSESQVIKQLCEMEFDDLKDYKTTSLIHDSVFNYILEYISTHLSNLRSLNSVKVIKEII